MRIKVDSGGGLQAVVYTFKKALEVGPLRLWKRMRAKNACKTCALGMGGMQGGMVNEEGHFPEVCKKSLQAQVADMQGALDADYFDKNPLDKLLTLTPKQAEDAGRIAYPVMHIEGQNNFKPVTWEFALEHIATALKNSRAVDPDEVAFYASGRSSNEAGFLLQSFSRVFGTNNVMNCSFYCHQASGVALKMTIGSGTATVELADIGKCDLVVLLGANPASNHPRLMTQLANLTARGGKVIVVNPIKELGLQKFRIPSQVKSMLFGSKVASQYLQPLAGGDIGYLTGVLKRLIETDKVNLDYLKNYTEDYQAVLDHATSTSWEQITKACGLSQAEINESATIIGAAKNVIFAWAMGLTHHSFGTDNVIAVANLALATGNVGKPGAGLLPIRGHSNVQGIGTVGVAPDLMEPVKLALEKIYGQKMPATKGLDTYAMMEKALAGGIKCLVSVGGNLWGSNPDSTFASAAMRNVDTMVYLSTKLNPGHFHGRGKTTIILPVLARDEEPEPTTQESMFNFVRLSEGGSPNIQGQLRSEAQIICYLANLVFGNKDFDWLKLTKASEVRKLIAEAIPALKDLASIDQTKKEFEITGRVLHTPKFNTLSGKAKMHVTPLPQFADDSLRLITIRSEGQFNSVVYEEYDLYRGIPHRHCIMVNKDDLSRLSIKDGERVQVIGEAGQLDEIEVVESDIKAGVVAMFYPESNVLIKANIDNRSKTPAFKSAPVRLVKVSN